MFNTTHILYMLISGVCGAALLIFLHLLHQNRWNVIVLRTLAILTVILHYSPLWVDFFTLGTATVAPEMLLPIHPCNVCMWLLLIAAFVTDKQGPAARLLKDFTFWGGTVCGAIGTVFNFNFAKTPTLTDFVVLKGLLSHSTMVVGCILLFTAGYVQIRVRRGVTAVLAGLLLFGVDGLIINGLYAAFQLEPCNAMYLVSRPFEAAPWLTTPVIGLMAMVAVFLLAALFEQVALPKDQRWYARFKRSNRSSESPKQ